MTENDDATPGIHFTVPWTFAIGLLGGGLGLGAGGALTLAPTISQESLAACYDISQQAIQIATNANSVAADHGTEIERIRRNTDDARRSLDLQSDDLRRLAAEIEVLSRRLELEELD